MTAGIPPAAGNPVPAQAYAPLRYAKEMAAISGCPPESARAIDTVGYRIVFADITDHRNFTPGAVLAPSRFIGGDAEKCCSGYGVSMFQTLDDLVKMTKRVCANAPMFLKRAGDHFAELKLAPDDGQCGQVSRSGHFDFYSRQNASPLSAVLRHEKLPE